MPGFRHSPLEDVQRIRQDLRDRYADGFPILKELLQNADDAGAGRPEAKATQFVIVLCPEGFPGGQHSLLQTSGVCVLNDGDFTAEDANSITSLGLSNKAGQAGAAGKFGLGLKSVFHWAEAFFYFSPHDFRSSSNRQASGNDLLNPWWSRYTESGRHKEWDEEWERTAHGDQIAFANFAKDSLGTERWFGLWIPLRIEAHYRDGEGEVLPILKDIPPSRPNDLFGEDWQLRLAETLPLLRRVQRVQVSVRRDSRIDLLADLRLRPESLRTNPDLSHQWPMQEVSRVLSGRILAHDGFSDAGFAGREWLNPLPSLKSLKDHKDWPNQSCIGPDGADLQVPEKAAPHGAVIFTCQQTSGGSAVRIQPAVFLPLGEPEEVKCSGATRYNLYLHGFFFVDSGRRRIQDETELPGDLAPEQATTEAHVMGLWNHTLMREVVSPLVLPSLDAFAKQERMEVGQIAVLVKAMSGSGRLEKLNKWVCNRQRFILRLQRSGRCWEHQTWKEKPSQWIELPATELPDSELFNLMPALEGLACQMTVSLKGQPRLADHKPSIPTDEDLAKLFGSVCASVFDEPRKLSYLLELIESGDMKQQSGSPAMTALIRLVNQLVGEQLPEDSKHANLWKEFFKRLPTTAFIRLPVESADVGSEIGQILRAANLPVALLWHDFRDAEGTGSIPFASLMPVLRGLSGLALHGEEAIVQRSTIAVRLLKACEQSTGEMENFRLFAASEPGKSAQAMSLADLRAAHHSSRLFTGGKDWAYDLSKAAPDIKPLILDSSVAEVLKLSPCICDSRACVALLHGASRLVAEFTNRKPLFGRLLQGARSTDADSWAALRCLLHGQLSQWQSQSPVFREAADQPLFTRLARNALDAVSEPWRFVSATVAGSLALNDEHQKQLKLIMASAQQVERLLKDVGPANVDCTQFSREEGDALLLHFEDVDVLRALNIHETTDKFRVRIAVHTYVDDGSFTALPTMFDRLVIRLRDRSAYTRFENADGFNRLVNKLSWDAVIEIALAQPEPTEWWSAILTAIGKIGNPRSDLSDRIRATAWLPLANGSPVKPTDLLHIPGTDVELDRLPPGILGDLVPLLRLREDVRNQEGFDTFTKTLLPKPEDALRTLAALLQHDTAWSTGLSDEWTAERVADWINALDRVSEQALPIARLVSALNAEDSIREFIPDFLKRVGGQLSEAAYAAILKHLATAHGNDKGQTVFLRYLEAIDGNGAEFAQVVLKNDGVLLLSAAGEWKPPKDLAPPTEGLSDFDVIARTWADSLPTVVKECRRRGVPPRQRHIEENLDTWQEMASQVRRFFQPWRQHLPSPEPIGAFLMLFSSPQPMSHLATEFFQSHSETDIRRWIEEHYSGIFNRLAHEFQHPIPHVEVESTRTTRVHSLIGNSFEARREDNPRTLVLGGDPCLEQGAAIMVNGVLQAGPRRRVLRLLPVVPFHHAIPDAVEMLRKAAEQVIAQTILERVDLKPLFDRISQAGQVEVQVAQSLVVESALGLLRQIGGHSHVGIRAALNQWDEARREEATAELLGLRHQQRAQQKRREAQRQIQDLLKDDASAHTALLEKVREKMQRYQYDASSVPFELWQNADDAISELQQLSGSVTEAKEIGFVVAITERDVAFAHFGRLINECRVPNGANLEDLGFGRDLEKMVVQSISDKAEVAEQGRTSLTGKFGLGFKSVFLVTEAPEVLSGSVDFVIRGGIYPVRLDEAQRITLENTLKEIRAKNWRRGTAIRLPDRVDKGVQSVQTLKLFRELAPLLVVFSRQLKRVRLRSLGREEVEIRWRPQPLAAGIPIEDAACGKLEKFDDGEAHHALVFSRAVDRDRIQFLLGLDENGFSPLPPTVPVFWVTAPTRATPGYGFAVNGPFEPDVGRVQLALQSGRNKRLAGELATTIAARLSTLFKLASEDWASLSRNLSLTTATTADAFWTSLWQVLGCHFANTWRKDDGNPMARLAWRILWECQADGLQSFYRNCAALPTGLSGDYRTQTRLRDLCHLAAGALDREQVFEIASRWPAFREKVRVGSICSHSQIALRLEALGVEVDAAKCVRLVDALEWELNPEHRVDPESADRLGQLITPEFLKNLREGDSIDRDEQEYGTLSELLGKVQFQATDGLWQKATELVVAGGDGVETDEKLRAAFAPRECCLHPAYIDAALAFFFACRPRLEANVEAMMNWVLQAKSEPTRIAALHYLLKGELKERLAEELRHHRDDSNWLWQLQAELSTWFEAAFPSEEERQEILAHRLRLFEEQLRLWTQMQQETGQAEAPREPWTVRELWLWWEQQGKPIGDYVLEGEANWPLFHDGNILGEEQRKAELKRLLLSPIETEGKTLWYRLFGYACLVSAGRHMTELRRFWLERLKPADFWHQTAQGDFSERTRKMFEQAVTAEFTNMAAGGERAYFWRRIFYDVRKMHGMVANDFPAVLLELVSQGRGEHLRQFLRTGHLPGPDQRRWIGTFGQSADTPLGFIIRELARIGVIPVEAVRPYAFYACRPVLRALVKIGWIADTDSGFSGEEWLTKLQEDPEHGPMLLPDYDIPLLHMGITHRGDKIPMRPS